MADDEKPSHTVTVGGKEYDVFGASSVDEAFKHVQKSRQDALNQEYTKSAETMPEWAKPFVAAKDVGVGAVDTLSAGLVPWGIDKIRGDDAATMNTAAVKDRMGWAGTALNTGLFARAIPSAVTSAVKYMGGGPAAKTLVGSTVSGAEGATYGGVDAATHGQDPGTGMLVGGVGGAGGYNIGNNINKGWKWLRGIDDIPANAGVKVMPKNPSNVDRAEITFNKAKANAARSDDVLATQKAVASGAEKLAQTPRGTGATPLYSPGQVRLLNKIAEGDPATNVTRKFGKYLDNKIIGATAGLGAGTAAGVGSSNPALGILAGLATTGAVSGAANLFKRVSAAGTEEALQNLRRTMTRTPKYIGPVSLAERNRIRLMAQKGLLDAVQDE
jgi:hypothetical protein